MEGGDFLSFWEKGPNTLKGLFEALFFVSACPACGGPPGPSGGLCPHCWDLIDQTASHRILSEGVGSRPRMEAYAACFYNNFIRDQFAQYKFMGKSYKQVIFQQILRAYLAKSPDFSRVRWIGYMPMRNRRALLRGYNPAQALAQAVAQEKGWALVHCLKKVREVAEQNKVDRKDRLVNVTGVYAADLVQGGFLGSYWVKGREKRGRIPLARLQAAPGILLDDLLTTGRTMQEGLGPLQDLGLEVVGLCLATPAYPKEEA